MSDTQAIPAVERARQRRSKPDATGIWKPLPVFFLFTLAITAGGYFVFQHDKETHAPINLLAGWMLPLMLSLVGAGGGIAVYRRGKGEKQREGMLEQQRLAEQMDYFSRHANDIILLHDSAGNIVDFNGRALAVYGYTAEELSGMNLSLLQATEFARPFEETREEVDLAGASRFESTHVKKDRNLFPVESSVRSINITGKKYYQAIIHDITERKSAEEKLRRSERGLAEAQRLAHLGSWELDLVSNVLTWSDENYRIFEIDPERFGASYEAFLNAVHPEDRDWVNKVYTDSVRNKAPYDIVHRLQFQDGRIKYVNEICETHYDEDGKPLRSIGTTHDITERRRMEQELQKQKSFMWQVMDTDPNQIFVRDAKGNFLLANQSAAAAHGMTPNEMLGKNLAEIDPSPEEAASCLQTDRELIGQGRKLDLVELHTLPSGEQRWMLMIKRRLTMPDGQLGELCIAVDITEQKRYEIELAESYKKLQQLSLHLENVRSDEREKIALNLHDEMGATLAAIKMGIAWLAPKLPADAPQLSAEAARITGLVSDGIHTMHQIVTQLRPNLLGDVGLAAAIKDYAKKFRRHSGIECILDLPEEELTLNESQSLTIFRILQESLTNVVKHARANRVDIHFAERGGSLQMVIKDNGIGFDPAMHMEQAFGLLGIRERALMVGGKTRISSAPGKGVRVSVSIPRAPRTD